MPRSRKGYSRASKRYSKRRRLQKKWRQQKLAVGTVAKIARKVALKLDKAHMKYHFFRREFLADGQEWPDGCLALPTGSAFQDVHGFEAKEISGLADFVSDLSATQATALQSKSLPVYIQGIQSRFIIQNRSNVSCICRAMLVYIPNLNSSTGQAVDNLRPDVRMLGKTGTGNLQYDGWMKKELDTGSSFLQGTRRYSILAQKKLYLAPTRPSGQYTAQTPPQTVPAYKTVHFTLSKYYKGFGKKCMIKSANATGAPLFDGNFYYLLWTDHAPGVTYSYCNVTQLKFRIGTINAPVNDA